MRVEHESYSIRYSPPGLVRAAEHECCIIYKDEQGQLYFRGFESTHESGGILYFPGITEWNDLYPDRADQRPVIRKRLIDYVHGDARMRAFERSLLDDSIQEQFPEAIRSLKHVVEPRSRLSVMMVWLVWRLFSPLLWLLLSARMTVKTTLLLGIVLAVVIYLGLKG